MSPDSPNNSRAIEESYGITLPFNELLKKVNPLLKEIKEFVESEYEEMALLWTTEYFKFEEQLKSDDKMLWDILEIMDLAGSAWVPTKEWEVWCNTSSFGRLFMTEPETENHITVESRKKCIDDLREEVETRINGMSTLERAGLSYEYYDGTGGNWRKEILRRYIIRNLPCGFVDDFRDAERLRRDHYTIGIMIDNFKFFIEENSARHCFISRSMLGILTQNTINLSIAKQRKVERKEKNE